MAESDRVDKGALYAFAVRATSTLQLQLGRLRKSVYDSGVRVFERVEAVGEKKTGVGRGTTERHLNVTEAYYYLLRTAEQLLLYDGIPEPDEEFAAEVDAIDVISRKPNRLTSKRLRADTALVRRFSLLACSPLKDGDSECLLVGVLTFIRDRLMEDAPVDKHEPMGEVEFGQLVIFRDFVATRPREGDKTAAGDEEDQPVYLSSSNDSDDEVPRPRVIPSGDRRTRQMQLRSDVLVSDDDEEVVSLSSPALSATAPKVEACRSGGTDGGALLLAEAGLGDGDAQQLAEDVLDAGAAAVDLAQPEIVLAAIRASLLHSAGGQPESFVEQVLSLTEDLLQFAKENKEYTAKWDAMAFDERACKDAQQSLKEQLLAAQMPAGVAATADCVAAARRALEAAETAERAAKTQVASCKRAEAEISVDVDTISHKLAEAAEQRQRKTARKAAEVELRDAKTETEKLSRELAQLSSQLEEEERQGVRGDKVVDLQLQLGNAAKAAKRAQLARLMMKNRAFSNDAAAVCKRKALRDLMRREQLQCGALASVLALRLALPQDEQQGSAARNVASLKKVSRSTAPPVAVVESSQSVSDAEKLRMRSSVSSSSSAPLPAHLEAAVVGTVGAHAAAAAAAAAPLPANVEAAVVGAVGAHAAAAAAAASAGTLTSVAPPSEELTMLAKYNKICKELFVTQQPMALGRPVICDSTNPTRSRKIALCRLAGSSRDGVSGAEYRLMPRVHADVLVPSMYYYLDRWEVPDSDIGYSCNNRRSSEHTTKYGRSDLLYQVRAFHDWCLAAGEQSCQLFYPSMDALTAFFGSDEGKALRRHYKTLRPDRIIRTLLTFDIVVLFMDAEHPCPRVGTVHADKPEQMLELLQSAEPGKKGNWHLLDAPMKNLLRAVLGGATDPTAALSVIRAGCPAVALEYHSRLMSALSSVSEVSHAAEMPPSPSSTVCSTAYQEKEIDYDELLRQADKTRKSDDEASQEAWVQFANGEMEPVQKTLQRLHRNEPYWLADGDRCQTADSAEAEWPYSAALGHSRNFRDLQKRMEASASRLFGKTMPIHTIFCEPADAYGHPCYGKQDLDACRASAVNLSSDSVVVLILCRDDHNCRNKFTVAGIYAPADNVSRGADGQSTFEFVLEQVLYTLDDCLFRYMVGDDRENMCECEGVGDSTARNESASAHAKLFGCTTSSSKSEQYRRRCTFRKHSLSKGCWQERVASRDKKLVSGKIEALVDAVNDIVRELTPIAHQNMAALSCVASDCRLGSEPAKSAFSTVVIGTDLGEHTHIRQMDVVDGISARLFLTEVGAAARQSVHACVYQTDLCEQMLVLPTLARRRGPTHSIVGAKAGIVLPVLDNRIFIWPSALYYVAVTPAVSFARNSVRMVSITMSQQHGLTLANHAIGQTRSPPEVVCKEEKTTSGREATPSSSGKRNSSLTGKEAMPSSSGKRTSSLTAKEATPSTSGKRNSSLTGKEATPSSSGKRTSSLTAKEATPSTSGKRNSSLTGKEATPSSSGKRTSSLTAKEATPSTSGKRTWLLSADEVFGSGERQPKKRRNR